MISFFMMIKKFIILFIVFFLLIAPSFADEVITGFEKKDLNALNEELRSNRVSTKSKYIYFVLPDEALAVGTNKIGRFYMDFAGGIKAIHASVSTVPTGANLIIDINKNGSTIWSDSDNRITVNAGEYTATKTSFNTKSFSAGDYFTIDIDQVGSTTPGGKLVVRVRIQKN